MRAYSGFGYGEEDITSNNASTFPELGTEVINFRPGLELIIGNHTVSQWTKVNYETPKNVCDLAFFLSGKMEGWIDGFSGNIDIPPLMSGLWLTPRMATATEFFPGQHIRNIMIRLQRSLLEDLAGSWLRNAPEDFRLIMENRKDLLYYQFAPMTIPMQAAVHQIFQCPYHGDMRRLFLESKVLELISRYFTHHFCENSDKGAPLSESDREKVSLARDFLMEQMENPPSLYELARFVGVSETRLKRGFRIMFGSSVFEYLREQRISKACMLLEGGDMNVTQVAYAVGFSSPSHFTHLFTQRCGIRPKDYYMGFRRDT